MLYNEVVVERMGELLLEELDWKHEDEEVEQQLKIQKLDVYYRYHEILMQMVEYYINNI